MDTAASVYDAVDWRELIWFCSVTAGLHAGVLGLLCVAMALVERYALFQEAKIQTKVHVLCFLVIGFLEI